MSPDYIRNSNERLPLEKGTRHLGNRGWKEIFIVYVLFILHFEISQMNYLLNL